MCVNIVFTKIGDREIERKREREKEKKREREKERTRKTEKERKKKRLHIILLYNIIV